MATTTNFGWETPDDTDLVKDGAAAMRTLGNSIDTSFVDLKGGTTGQVLAKASNTDLDYTWTTVAGDIEGVTAGTGLSGGGTSGTVTLTNTMATAIDAKGDLVVGTGADTFSRLAVGTNNHVLTADSTTATGLKWAAASGGKVLQVVESTTTTYATNSTSTYADTGVSVSITPSASTSKVLVFANVFAMKSGSNSSSACQLTLLRGSTVINGTGDYNLYTATAMPLPVMTTLMKLDSPATTASTTYKVQFRNPANVAAAIINNYNSDTTNLPVSSIIALEIGA